MIILQKSLFVFLGLILLITACGRIQQSQTAADVGVTLEMTIEPEQPMVGPAYLIFTLTDKQGNPINDAALKVEGNMTHAGMVPVLAQTNAGQQGRYTVPFEWSMRGDWLVTVEVTLAGGQKFSRQIPVVVQ
jgi:hypothetical protein